MKNLFETTQKRKLIRINQRGRNNKNIGTRIAIAMVEVQVGGAIPSAAATTTITATMISIVSTIA